MDNGSFFALLRSFAQLSPMQLERAQEHLRDHLQRNLLHQALAEQQAVRPDCPHCHATRVIHWGQAHGQQRYRCLACRKTFNQLHQAALAGLHHKHKWADYADCLRLGLSLRKAAKACGINLKTAFRWRHRFLRYALTTGASRLAGIIEADEVFTPESFKGRRQMPRPARRHGRRGHGHVPLVPALIAMDRYGRESDAVLLDKGLREIKPVLQPLLTAGSILCTDGNQSYIKIAEAGAGIIHKRLIAKEHHRVEDEVFHIQTLNNYVSRWRGWMEKFHGVGTAYLANYLAWFRVVVQEPNTARSWLQGGVKRLANT
ncbi:IS1595 family transposase [Aeromonas sanarellii]|uniref:IS1595 family transposase n=1 Tax=Aeromonas caviae TaxID=648 RepID=UPI00191E85F6|nr:IS1595 family transposase [Aeromonas caviae]MBL0582922.1 IS1595 family transposase [Aeromonas caviae]